MKKYLYLSLVLLAAVLQGAVVLDEKYTICPEKGATEGETRYNNLAAELLRDTLERSTGVKLAVGPRGAKNIFIGRSAAAPAPKERWSCRVSVDKKGNIRFAGSYSSDPVRGKKYLELRRHESGALFGVTAFLKEFCNFRVHLPGRKGRFCDKKGKITLPDNFSRLYRPAGGYVIARETADPVYDTANGFLGAPWYYTYGGHTYPVAVPRTLFKSKPQYFMLTANKKRYSGHYCISNPEFQELVWKEILKRADQGYEWIQLGPEDAFSLCRCQACAKLYGVRDAGEKIWIFHKKLAERLLKERPGKKLVLLNYSPNWEVPKTFKEFPSNVMIDHCRYSEADLKKWASHKLRRSVYIYNWGYYHPEGFTPKMTPAEVAAQIGLLRKYGIRDIYRCGFGELFGLEGPVYRVFGEAVSSPRAVDADRVVRQFCKDIYGPAAADMEQFYKALYSRLAVKLPISKDYSILGSLLPCGFRNMELLAMRYPASALPAIEKHLSAAEKKLPRSTELKLVRIEFDFLKTTCAMAESFVSYRKAPSTAALRKVRDTVKSRDAFLKKHATKRQRLPYAGNVPVLGAITVNFLRPHGRWMGNIIHPIVWPLDELISKEILPGARKILPDGKKHHLLPGKMNEALSPVTVAVTRTPEGLKFRFAGLQFKHGTDRFRIYLKDAFHTLRPGNRTIWSYKEKPGSSPRDGGSYSGAPDNTVPVVNDKDGIGITLPWKKIGPASGEIPCNFVFTRSLPGKPQQVWVFEPDLTYMNEYRTIYSGRGKLQL